MDFVHKTFSCNSCALDVLPQNESDVFPDVPVFIVHQLFLPFLKDEGKIKCISTTKAEFVRFTLTLRKELFLKMIFNFQFTST